MKVWVLSHAYAAPVNHDKLRVLASLPDLELTLLTPTRWRTAFGVVEPPASAPGYRIIRSRVHLNGHAGVCLYRDGWRELRAAKPDVLHAEVEGWSLAALQAVSARVAPVVLFTWENRRGPRRRLARVIERVVLRRVAFVIAGSGAARARVLRLGVPSERVIVLPQFGVDTTRYVGGAAMERGGGPGRRPVVGYVGRLVAEKGVDVLMDAAEPLEVQVLVVGAGPERATLERRVASWSPGKVIFTGAIAHEDVPDHLAALDVLVLPSRTTPGWAEQFGHVLIEAMAAGVPVVGSVSGAIPEVVGDAGLLFPEGDAAALRARLRELLDDGALRRTVVERGRARVAQCYTHDVIAAAQRDVYARVRGA
jgi:glycosyltransferase involved in cell wall biosynthesis